jgi:isopenicillin-N epimerase
MAAHWGTRLLGPEAVIGTMATVPLPAAAGSTEDDARRLRDALLFAHGIEVAVMAGAGEVRVRVSAQVYNQMSDIERLIVGVDRVLAQGLQ